LGEIEEKGKTKKEPYSFSHYLMISMIFIDQPTVEVQTIAKYHPFGTRQYYYLVICQKD